MRALTAFGPVPFVPEISLYQATDEATRSWIDADTGPTPYWAYPWPGGQALSRYLLDHPELVRGKRVLDFASGSGLIGIAAAKAGAAHVMAFDIDPIAKIATLFNAEKNDVRIENLRKVAMEKAFDKADIIVTGDVCYSSKMTARIMRWLYICVDMGIPVYLGDPARAYVPKTGLHELARYEVPVLRDLEDADSRPAYVWKVGLPDY